MLVYKNYLANNLFLFGIKHFKKKNGEFNLLFGKNDQYNLQDYLNKAFIHKKNYNFYYLNIKIFDLLTIPNK